MAYMSTSPMLFCDAIITFLSLYQSIPYEAYKGILFLHKDHFFCTQRYLFVPTSSPPFCLSHVIIPSSSPLFSPSLALGKSRGLMGLPPLGGPGKAEDMIRITSLKRFFPFT
jgi:hypothetical protein